jgi:exonuclease V gamma subunit
MKIKLEQVQRITHMEQLLNEAAAAVSTLDQAIEGYRAAQKNIAELRRYYEGSEWMEDVKADEDGKLPSDLPRGVLTEDAIYDLLTDEIRLREVFRELGGQTENER